MTQMSLILLLGYVLANTGPVRRMLQRAASVPRTPPQVYALVCLFADFFVSISGEQTLGLWSFLAGGLINMFVPSGGGQFAVQAPIFLEAAGQLGVDPAVVIMGIAYGDQWTNMIQPFWALPLLAIAGLRIRDVMGFTTVTLVVSGAVFAATMLLAS
jgi:short-chain fatty acids transporter